MRQNLTYKNIHIGAIATFYIIALLLRLISLYYHHGDVVSVASRFKSAECLIFPASAFRFMGNRKGGE